MEPLRTQLLFGGGGGVGGSKLSSLGFTLFLSKVMRSADCLMTFFKNQLRFVHFDLVSLLIIHVYFFPGE